MDWSQFQRIDPHLLVGIVNTELRNQADSLDDLCRTHDIDARQLLARLETADYYYHAEHKQFR